jgi:hypothetical protein
MVRVELKGTYGYGRPRVYYGPGVVDVPEGLARTLGLRPIQDAAGAPESAPPDESDSGGLAPAPAPKRRGRTPKAE